jgi:CubicO group peptidase (beta-lactamase class C family)
MAMYRRAAAALLLLAVSVLRPGSLPAQAAPATVAQRLNTYVSKLARSGSFSGAILVARQGTILLDRGYGLANRSSGRKATPATRMRIFDITRQFVAVAILQLQEEGKLHVEDLACRYLPSCPGRWFPITIHELLTNTSGIPGFSELPGLALSRRLTPAQVMAIARRRPLDFAPGQGFGYSETDYILLGLILEHVTGRPLAQVLHDRIFAPLGMAGTGLLRDGRVPSGLARGYEGTHPAQPVDDTTPWAAAGMYSTVDDLYRWDQALTPGRLISQESLDAMFTRYVDVPPETEVGYGYGWLVGTIFNRYATFHGGGAPGFEAINLRFPQDGVTMIILSNQALADMGEMETHLVPILFGSAPGNQG